MSRQYTFFKMEFQILRTGLIFKLFSFICVRINTDFLQHKVFFTQTYIHIKPTVL